MADDDTSSESSNSGSSASVGPKSHFESGHGSHSSFSIGGGSKSKFLMQTGKPNFAEGPAGLAAKSGALAFALSMVRTLQTVITKAIEFTVNLLEQLTETISQALGGALDKMLPEFDMKNTPIQGPTVDLFDNHKESSSSQSPLFPSSSSSGEPSELLPSTPKKHGTAIGTPGHPADVYDHPNRLSDAIGTPGHGQDTIQAHIPPVSAVSLLPGFGNVFGTKPIEERLRDLETWKGSVKQAAYPPLERK